MKQYTRTDLKSAGRVVYQSGGKQYVRRRVGGEMVYVAAGRGGGGKAARKRGGDGVDQVDQYALDSAMEIVTRMNTPTLRAHIRQVTARANSVVDMTRVAPAVLDIQQTLKDPYAVLERLVLKTPYLVHEDLNMQRGQNNEIHTPMIAPDPWSPAVGNLQVTDVVKDDNYVDKYIVKAKYTYTRQDGRSVSDLVQIPLFLTRQVRRNANVWPNLVRSGAIRNRMHSDLHVFDEYLRVPGRSGAGEMMGTYLDVLNEFPTRAAIDAAYAKGDIAALARAGIRT